MLGKLFSFFRPKPVTPMTFGIIAIDQSQFVDLVKGEMAQVWDADGGWKVNAQTLARPIFVPFNQTFVFADETIKVQRSQQLEAILDRIDAVPAPA